MHRALTAIVIVSTISISAAGCASTNSPPVTQTSAALATSASASPAASSANPESLIVVDKLPSNVVEHGIFAALNATEKAFIKKYEAMDITTFRAQPEQDQLRFAQFVFDNNWPITQYRLNKNQLADAYPTIDSSTPQGMLNNSLKAQVLASSLKSSSDTNGVGYDSITAKKLAILSTTLSVLHFKVEKSELLLLIRW